MKKCKLTLVRVPYGRKDTPVELREYYVKEFPTSAVGTKKEIREFVRKKFKCEPKFVIEK